MINNSTRIVIDRCRKGAFVMTLFLLVTSIQAAFAHGGFEHVMGAVTKISAQSVTVETTAKKVVEVGLTSKTTYTRDNKKVAVADMKIGDRVVIDATQVNEKLVAASVKLGAAASKSVHASQTKKRRP